MSAVKARLARLEEKFTEPKENPMKTLPARLAVALAMKADNPPINESRRQWIAEYEEKHGPIDTANPPKGSWGSFLAQIKRQHFEKKGE